MKDKIDQLTNQLAKEITLGQHFQAKSSEFETQIRLLIAENFKQNERFDLLQAEFLDQIHQLKIQNAKQEEEIRLLNLRNYDNIAAFESSENKNANFASDENGMKSDVSP